MTSGDTISRYRIIGPLGRGGMGVVYHAEDTRLQRPVALKFLPPDSLEERDRERFLNEARAAARIRHPNVCPIYDVEEADGQVFISMAYLEGETLARRIARAPFEIRAAIDIAIQVANGLEKAHELGIVHRDIKSSNIFLSPDGHASILDFGLALLPGAVRLTGAGLISGTPAYMSPEQARGDDVDQRTDVWSLGVVLFEMLAGTLPFRGSHPAAVTHAIVFDPAPGIASLRIDLPDELDATIRKALAKRPEDRWQRARDFAAELQDVQQKLTSRPLDHALLSGANTKTIVVATPPRRRARHVAALALTGLAAAGGVLYYSHLHYSDLPGKRAPEQAAIARSATRPKQIAVLPFQITGSSEKLRTIADGLVEVLTEALSDNQRFQGKILAVPSNEIRRREISSVADAKRIYDVDLAITGRAQSQGDKIQFALAVVDAARSQQIGTTTFVYDPASPRDAKNRAVEEVGRLLKLDVTPAALARSSSSESGTPDAYSAYLEGRGLLSRYDVRGNLEKAIASFKHAIDVDPKFPLAWAGLGEAYWRLSRQNSEKQTAALARESAERAVQLDPGLAIVHTVLGTIYGTAGRNEEAIKELQTAVQLSPGNADAPRELARIYTSIGRLPEAEASYLKAIQARPTDWYGYLLLGIFYNGRERYNEAEGAFKHALELAPDNDIAARNLGSLYEMEGRYGDAIAILQRSLKVRQYARTYATLAATYFYQHRFQEAASAAETAIDLDSSRPEYWGNLGIYYKWIPGAEARTAPALRRAIELAEKRREVTPTDYGIRADLAEYRARLGDAKGAMAEIDAIPATARQGLASRLAIAYELTGNRAKAIELIGLTLTNAASLTQIRDDPDLASLWADPHFQQAIRRVSNNQQKTF